MSVIKVSCIDQVLTFTDTPIISSGDVNLDRVKFTFSSEWDGFGKICAFYQKKGDIYYSLVDENNEALIPAEVLSVQGTIYFAVIGLTDEITRTSTALSYHIDEGAVVSVEDPDTNIYTQLIASYGRLMDEVNNVKADRALYIYEKEDETVDYDNLINDDIISPYFTYSSYKIDNEIGRNLEPITDFLWRFRDETLVEIQKKLNELQDYCDSLDRRVRALELK